MGEGRDRNAPCWCGSGKKYKRCHLERDREPRIEPWEADRGLREHYGAKRCMAPEPLRGSCDGRVVRAHTVSKSGSLARIARDGHVYSFLPSVQRLAKTGGVLVPELLGVNRASTFTGFCAHHDKDLFAPLEDEPMVFSKQQCFLLGYRAMSRELFLKEAQLESMGLLRGADKGRDKLDQLAIQTAVSALERGTELGASDSLRHKGFYDAVLEDGDFESVAAYVVTLSEPPPVMCSAGLFPYEMFDGSYAQDFADLDRPADAIYYNAFATDQGGAVVFTWLPDSGDTCNRFIASLEAVPDTLLSTVIMSFFFEYCENVHIAPDWWEGLDAEVTQALVQRLGDAANPFKERPSDCLVGHESAVTDWGIVSRYRVGPTSG